MGLKMIMMKRRKKKKKREDYDDDVQNSKLPSAQDDPSNHLRMLSWNGINCSLHNIYSYILYYRFVDSILLKRINHDHLHSVIQFALGINRTMQFDKAYQNTCFLHTSKKLRTRSAATSSWGLKPQQNWFCLQNRVPVSSPKATAGCFFFSEVESLWCNCYRKNNKA